MSLDKSNPAIAAALKARDSYRRRQAKLSPNFDMRVDALELSKNQRYRRAVVYVRDAGVCANCGKKVSEWHVDHIDAKMNGGLETCIKNLQTLCVPCHKEKTRKDYRVRTRRREDAAISTQR